MSIFILVLSLLMMVNCSQSSMRTNESEIYFYKRDEGGGNEKKLYFDHLAITNYVDGSFSASQLLEIAKKYIDTSKADRFISIVTFLGQRTGCQLPVPDPDNPVEKYNLLSFGFKEVTAGSKTDSIELDLISIWKNGESELLWSVIPNEKMRIDSILTSKTEFRNGF